MAKEDSKGRVVAAVSGEVIIAKISGEVVQASVSGSVVIVSGQPVATSVSGNVVVARVSGETIFLDTPTAVKTGSMLQVPSASGGVALTSGAIKSATVQSESGLVLIGGQGTERPWFEAFGSSQGFRLQGGKALSLDVHDFSDIVVCAVVSGDWVSFIGIN